MKVVIIIIIIIISNIINLNIRCHFPVKYYNS